MRRTRYTRSMGFLSPIPPQPEPKHNPTGAIVMLIVVSLLMIATGVFLLMESRL